MVKLYKNVQKVYNVKMNDKYRLNRDKLLSVLSIWDSQLQLPVLLVACGGTALTLQGYKSSTKDVDFLVPYPDQFEVLAAFLHNQGYERRTGYGYKHPKEPWIFDLFIGQTIFQTELLDPIHESANHRVIKAYDHLILACLNSEDLIISKMFRGTLVDVQDSVLLIEEEHLDLGSLGIRYVETASYYHNPEKCKKNMGYLIAELDEKGIDTDLLVEVYERWNQ